MGFKTFTLSALFLAISSLISAAPPSESYRYANILSRQNVQDTYDYVIVGGGTAGLTVGDRLTADGKYTVLVIENGVLDNDTAILQGGGGGGMAPSRLYTITSKGDPELQGRTTSVMIGKVVGGSSAVNGMVYTRGTAEEYDMWAALGGPGSTWDWKGLLPYFRKATYFTPPTSGLASGFNVTYDMNAWGQTDGVYASFPTYQQPALKVLYEAMRDFPGVDTPKDGAAGTNGLFFNPSSMDPQRFWRSYSRTVHWDNVGPQRPNYNLLTGQQVIKINFEGDVAVGVNYRPSSGGTVKTVKARKEVILAAGAVHSPWLLQNSGIGPAALLQQAGIAVKVDLPGVGQNFQDHGYISNVGYRWTRTPPTPSVPGNGNSATVAGPNCGAWIGMPVISPEKFEDIAKRYEQQDPARYLPTGTHSTVIAGYKAQQAVYAKALRSKGVSFLEYLLSGLPGGSVINLHPVSRGTININPSNPLAVPIVDYRALSNPIDMDVTVEMIKFVRRYMSSGALAQYGAVETSPGPSRSTDAQIAEWIRTIYSPTVFHPIGTTAKMPRELGGVVNEDLLVYGVKQLSVVDGGIMPVIIGATTQQTVYAIAEKAADLIKARAGNTGGGSSSSTTSTTSSTTSTSTTIRTTSTTVITPTPTCTVQKYGQCGGNNYSGCTSCASGSTCNKLNDWYSQCV